MHCGCSDERQVAGLKMKFKIGVQKQGYDTLNLHH